MLHGLVKKEKIQPTFSDVDPPLTERELDVLRPICQELTTTEIAGKLFLSPRTVEGYRNNMMQKIGAKNLRRAGGVRHEERLLHAVAMHWYRWLLPMFLLLARSGTAQTDTLELPSARSPSRMAFAGHGEYDLAGPLRLHVVRYQGRLNRYDGYTFTVYRHDPEDTTSLRVRYIHSILEDKQGRLWVGTGKGLDLFDRERERCGHLRIGEPSTGQVILTIAQDAHHDLWVSNDNGVIKLTFTGAESTDGCRHTRASSCWTTPVSSVPSVRGPFGWANWTWAVSASARTTCGNDQVDTLHLEWPVGDTRAGRSSWT